MPEKEFELFLNVLGKLLHMDPRQTAAIADEFRDHLETRLVELRARGFSRDQAIERALDEFGDAAGLASQFTSLDRRRKRRLIMRCALALVCCGVGVFLAIGFLSPDPQQPFGPQIVAQDTQPVSPDSTSPEKPLDASAKSHTEVEKGIQSIDEPMPLKALKNPAKAQFIDTPLGDVVSYLSDQHKVPILLDKVELDKEGIASDHPINLVVNDGIPLHQVLNTILEPINLTWVYEDEVLKVTSQVAAERKLVTKTYDLNKLTVGKKAYPRDVVIHLLQSTTGAEWEEIDGVGGTIAPLGNTLVIRQTQAVHRRIQQLISAVTRINQSTWAALLTAPAHQKLGERLGQPSGPIEFIDTPLKDGMEFLSEKCRIPIVIDEEALLEEGIAIDEPLDLFAKNLSLRSTLKLLLDPIDLTYVLKNSTLVITTKTVADETLETAVYRVNGLVQSPEQMTELALAIQDGTGGLWMDTDGIGGEQVPLGTELLVVRNTQQVQREIRELLIAQDRLAEGESLPATTPELVTRSYEFEKETAEGLLKALPALVAKETWVNQAAFPANGRRAEKVLGNIFLVDSGREVRDVESERTNDPQRKKSKKKPAENATGPTEYLVIEKATLLIQQTRDVHRQIERFLRMNGFPAGHMQGGSVPQNKN